MWKWFSCLFYASIQDLSWRKWWWSGWSFLFCFFMAVSSKIVLPTYSSTDIFFIRTASFYLNSSCFFGFKYSFSLALIFFLLHLWSCTHVLSFLDRSVIFVCFHYFFFDMTTIEDLIAGTLNDTLREKLLLVSEQEWLLGCFWPFSCVYTIN